MSNETTNKQIHEIEGQGLIMQDRSTALELSLDELSYVSGGTFFIRPIKPWYCGQE
jgi:hypothetical protein